MKGFLTLALIIAPHFLSAEDVTITVTNGSRFPIGVTAFYTSDGDAVDDVASVFAGPLLPGETGVISGYSSDCRSWSLVFDRGGLGAFVGLISPCEEPNIYFNGP